MLTTTEDLIRELDGILSDANDTVDFKNMKFMDEELLKRLKRNKKALIYVDQYPKGWHKLREKTIGRTTVEKVIMLAADRAKTVSECLEYLLPHVDTPEELKKYVLSRATALATISEEYLLLAQKYPRSNEKEEREHLLAMASRVARSTDDYVKTIAGTASHGFDLEGRHKKAIRLLIERAILSVDASFEAIDKIYGIFTGCGKSYYLVPEKYVDFFERLTIECALRSDIPFVFKESLAGLELDGKSAEAKKLMTCIIILEGMRKDSQNLPEDSPSRKIIEGICQNNQ